MCVKKEITPHFVINMQVFYLSSLSVIMTYQYQVLFFKLTNLYYYLRCSIDNQILEKYFLNYLYLGAWSNLGEVPTVKHGIMPNEQAIHYMSKNYSLYKLVPFFLQLQLIKPIPYPTSKGGIHQRN